MVVVEDKHKGKSFGPKISLEVLSGTEVYWAWSEFLPKVFSLPFYAIVALAC